MMCSQKVTTKTVAGVLIAGLVQAAGSAVAQPTVLFSNIGSSPTSSVPGLAGAKFAPGATGSFRLDRLFVSPDGTKYVLSALTDRPTSTDEVVIVGTFAGGASVVAQEGTALPPGTVDGILYGFIRTQMGINDAGDFAFSADTNAATSSDEMVIKFSAGSGAFSLSAREGQAIGATGFNAGGVLNAVHIQEDGTVRYRSNTGSGATLKDLLVAGSSLLAESDVSEPASQLVAPAQTVNAFATDRFISSPDGSRVIFVGDLNGPTTSDRVLVVDDVVAAQEGAELTGLYSGVPVFSLVGDAGSQVIASSGDYLFRGNNLDDAITPFPGNQTNNRDWVVKGVGSTRRVIAQTDAAIAPGRDELWDDTRANQTLTFFLNALNGRGDHVVGGYTNNADASRDWVVVLNESQVVLREGDGVDVNGNGLLDDNAFISAIDVDDVALTDGRVFVAVARLRDGLGADFAEAYITLDLNPFFCTADFTGDGFVDDADFVTFAAAYELFTVPPAEPAADLNGDGFVDDADFVEFAAAYEAFVCP